VQVLQFPQRVGERSPQGRQPGIVVGDKVTCTTTCRPSSSIRPRTSRTSSSPSYRKAFRTTLSRFPERDLERVQVLQFPQRVGERSPQGRQPGIVVPRLSLWDGDPAVASADECRRLARVGRGEFRTDGEDSQNGISSACRCFSSRSASVKDRRKVVNPA
jgi:hypothetical protein